MSRFPHILISASAGTGKTFRLSNRYIGLLHSGVMPDQILATTFTRKAAGEILDRVIKRLAEAALDAAKRQELAQWLGVASLPPDECHAMLRHMLRHLHRVRVSTLDAFFAQLAGSFSLELHLPPGWRIVEESHEQYLRDEAIARTLQGHSTAEVQRLLHLMAKGDAQQSVSGLVRRTIEHLYGLYLETDIEAWRKIPQSRPLSSEALATAIQQLRDVPLPDDDKYTDSRTAELEAVEQGDWETFISRGMAAKVATGEPKFNRKTMPAAVVEIHERLLQHARAVLLDQLARQTEATYELLNKFHQAYQQLKQQTGALRFDDVTRALTVSDRLGGIDRQHFRLDTSLAHLLLDEFQDTSLAQWQVLRPLARRVTSDGAATATPSPPGPPSFLCVGDTKQAIYAWRGGISEIFHTLPKELTHLDRDWLTESHRSAPPVIDAVNLIFGKLTRHDNLERCAKAVTDWQARFPQHTTARTMLPGYVELCTVRDADEGEEDADAKFAAAAERIEQLFTQAPGCSVGVLTRRNDVVKKLINELRQRGVAASEEGGNPLSDSLPGQVILSLLRMADHPGDLIARYHVAQSPLAPQLDYPNHTDDARTRALAQEVRTYLLHAGYGQAIRHWAEQLLPSCDRHDASRLQQFVELAYAYGPLATLRTADFQRYVNLTRVADPTTAEVRVMTVHQAKGLQFDIVVLPDLDAQFPGQPDAFVTGQPSPTEPIDQVCLYRNESFQALLPRELQQLFEAHRQQAVEEALCVLYVAVTRAIYSLHMLVKPSSKSERKLPRTFAGLVRAALTDGQRLASDEIAYRAGDPRWYEQLPPPQVLAAASTPAELDRPVVLAPMPVDSRREFVSPSQLEGGARVRVAKVLDLGGSVAKARGTLMHALFEQIAWLDEGPPDMTQLRRVAASSTSSGLDIEHQLRAFQNMIDKPDVNAALRRTFYEAPRDQGLQQALAAAGAGTALRTQVHNERRFAVLDEGHVLSGSIDRLVLLYAGDRLVAADIIDFKTDAVDRDEQARLDQLVDFYRPQLQAYRRAVSAMYHLPLHQICTRLLFVSPGVMCESRE